MISFFGYKKSYSQSSSECTAIEKVIYNANETGNSNYLIMNKDIETTATTMDQYSEAATNSRVSIQLRVNELIKFAKNNCDKDLFNDHRNRLDAFVKKYNGVIDKWVRKKTEGFGYSKELIEKNPKYDIGKINALNYDAIRTSTSTPTLTPTVDPSKYTPQEGQSKCVEDSNKEMGGTWFADAMSQVACAIVKFMIEIAKSIENLLNKIPI